MRGSLGPIEMNGNVVTDRQRARFEAVRKRVFEEMLDVAVTPYLEQV